MIKTMSLKPSDLLVKIKRLFEYSGKKILEIQESCPPGSAAPVYTVRGKYTSRGWTEWTQGFQYGSAILQYEASGDETFLEIGRSSTVTHMANHLSHMGVHDHGFNNISTYGNLLRLMREGTIPADEWEARFYELALKVSGAVQAARWTGLPGNLGYIYSFNGPHSLFVDTIRTLRVLAVAHQLGHTLMGEQDRRISLLERLLQHAETTARYNIYFGEGRDAYDIRGRTVHEVVFNITNGSYRCPSTQQGFSPFSTWTRGLAWALCGFAEQIEFIDNLSEDAFAGLKAGNLEGKEALVARMAETCEAVGDFYIEHSPTDGIPYWDTGAPGLANLGDYLEKDADPFNDFEPVDSSASAIAAQGLLRLGHFLGQVGKEEHGERYFQSGLRIADTLFEEPYLATAPNHQGLILHSVYHRPKGWDYIPEGRKIPAGEATMWGDYHAREMALYLKRLAEDKPYYTFWR